MTSTESTIRTYETFEIRWDRGSTWTNYDSAEEAQATIDASPSSGHVVRRTFEVRIPADLRHLYKGDYIAERAA